MKLPPPNRNSAHWKLMEKIEAGTDTPEDHKAADDELHKETSRALHHAHSHETVTVDLRKLDEALAMLAQAIGKPANASHPE